MTRRQAIALALGLAALGGMAALSSQSVPPGPEGPGVFLFNPPTGVATLNPNPTSGSPSPTPTATFTPTPDGSGNLPIPAVTAATVSVTAGPMYVPLATVQAAVTSESASWLATVMPISDTVQSAGLDHLHALAWISTGAEMATQMAHLYAYPSVTPTVTPGGSATVTPAATWTPFPPMRLQGYFEVGPAGTPEGGEEAKEFVVVYSFVPPAVPIPTLRTDYQGPPTPTASVPKSVLALRFLWGSATDLRLRQWMFVGTQLDYEGAVQFLQTDHGLGTYYVPR